MSVQSWWKGTTLLNFFRLNKRPTRNIVLNVGYIIMAEEDRLLIVQD
jgi:hypothetical protein